MTRLPITVGDLAEELRGLLKLSRSSLAERWGALYGAPPPSRTSRSLMIRAVAYKLQEQAYGGLAPATRRILMRLREAESVAVPSPELRSGSVLVREWQGTAHRVTVIDDGFVYRDKRYGSLSEIARIITGSRWSGPRFFGLKSHGKA